MQHSLRAVITSMIAALLFSSFTANAQTDFSGTWTCRDQQNISGNLYSNGSPKQMTFTQTGSVIIIERVTAGADGKDFTATDTLAFDGKGVENDDRLRKKMETTLTWNADKSGFTTVTISYNPTNPAKSDFKTTDTWTIENDELVLQHKAENFTNGEVWESKAMYEKN